jgi:hypothetical protein
MLYGFYYKRVINLVRILQGIRLHRYRTDQDSQNYCINSRCSKLRRQYIKPFYLFIPGWKAEVNACPRVGTGRWLQRARGHH